MYKILDTLTDPDMGRILEYLIKRRGGAIGWAKPAAIAESKAFLRYKAHRELPYSIYLVEDILERKIDDEGRMQYKVFWSGWSISEASWVYRSNLQCPFNAKNIPWAEGHGPSTH